MHFAKAQTIKKPMQVSVIAASLYVALFFVVAVMAQLFAFEDFPGIIESYGMLANSDLTPLIAAVIVSLEVLAIPYLLWMRVSHLMRILSLVSGWLVLFYWLVVGLWQSVVDLPIANAGLFGAKIVLPQGWWLVSFVLILIVLLGYVTASSKLPQHPSK